jgi:hypothetical protein
MPRRIFLKSMNFLDNRSSLWFTVQAGTGPEAGIVIAVLI